MRDDRRKEVITGLRAAANALEAGDVYGGWNLAHSAHRTLDCSLTHTVVIRVTADSEILDVDGAKQVLDLSTYMEPGEDKWLLAAATSGPMKFGTYGSHAEAESYAMRVSMVGGLTAHAALRE